MSDHRDDRVAQMQEFEDRLRAMAAREIAAEARVQRPPWRRRAAVGCVFGIGLAAAAAGASQLISVGEPVTPKAPPIARYQPGVSTPIVVVTAADSEVGTPWGVSIYDTRGGERCVKVGQLRGTRVGVIEGGLFRPYGDNVLGDCGKPAPARLIFDVRRFSTRPRRALVYGRAGRLVKRVRLSSGAASAETRVGQGGAFVFVLDDSRSVDTARVTPLDRTGQPLP